MTNSMKPYVSLFLVVLLLSVNVDPECRTTKRKRMRFFLQLRSASRC
jgi:hypothetical protein